jgi:hypothetical protein
MTDQFKLPSGYKAWCHLCGESPFNKVTEVPVPTGIAEEQELAEIGLEVKVKTRPIPGLGFHSIDECTKHDKAVHRTWKG